MADEKQKLTVPFEFKFEKPVIGFTLNLDASLSFENGGMTVLPAISVTPTYLEEEPELTLVRRYVFSNPNILKHA